MIHYDTACKDKNINTMQYDLIYYTFLIFYILIFFNITQLADSTDGNYHCHLSHSFPCTLTG